MNKHSKRYREAAAMVAEADREQFTVAEVVDFIKRQPKTKFDETVELALNLNIDPRKSDQIVRGSFSLPHGVGKSVRVVAFCEGADAEAAKDAGAVEVGGEDLAERIQGGWMDFDVAIAHPAMMKFVGKLGKVLGPKGLMPSPKSGTVTPQVADAVREFAAGKIEFRNDPQGNVAVAVGKASFEASQLEENLTAMLDHINGMRPAVVKGVFITGATVSTTMGVGYPLAL